MSRVPITDEIRAEFLRLREETGVSSRKLLRGRHDKPDGLNASIIDQWMAGNTNTAKPDHLDYVLGLWNAVDPVIPITPAMQAHFEAEMTRTALTPARFMRVFGGGSAGVTKVLLDKISARRRKTIPQAQWHYITDSMASRKDA